jgi:hypothetical protein
MGRQTRRITTESSPGAAPTAGLALDGKRSAKLWLDPDGPEEIVLPPMQLRWLDVEPIVAVPGPSLRRLDLRALGPGLRLTLWNCTALEELLLSGHGPGVRVRIRCEREVPSGLSLRGLVGALDAAWPDPLVPPVPAPHAPAAGGRRGPAVPLGAAASPDAPLIPLLDIRCPLGRRRKQPARAAWVGPWPPPAASDAEVVLVAGLRSEAAPISEQAAITLPGGELLLQAVPGLRKLRLRPRPESHCDVRIVDLPELAVIEGDATLGSMGVDRCPALSRIEPPGAVLHLSEVAGLAGATLEITGAWFSLWLSRSQAAALHAPRVRRLCVTDCLDLRDVDAPLAKTSPVSQSDSERRPEIEAMLRRPLDETGCGIVLDWVSSVSSPRDTLVALRALSMLAGLGWDAAALWDARRCLSERNRLISKKNHAIRWNWNLPADLSHLGWADDLLLWVRCAPNCPEAADFGDVLRASGEPAHVDWFFGALRYGPLNEAERGMLASVTAEALLHGAEHGARLRASPHSESPSLSDVARAERVVAYLLAMRERPCCRILAGPLCHWIARRMPDRHGITLLASLREHGCADAAIDLLVLAQDERLEQYLRGRAWAFALAAPVDSALAPPPEARPRARETP